MNTPHIVHTLSVVGSQCKVLETVRAMKNKVLPRNGGFDKLRNLKSSIEEFVQTADDTFREQLTATGSNIVTEKNRRNRKQLRKEKRKLKKLKKKEYYERRHLNIHLSGKAEENCKEKYATVDKGKHQGSKSLASGSTKVKESIKKGEVPKTLGKVPDGKNSSNTVRKRSLLEANIQEDKEIKRLEKKLRLNRRKNKTTLTPSFVRDGLDYILGILEPGGRSLSGLYNSDEENNTKDTIAKLADSDAGTDEDTLITENEKTCQESGDFSEDEDGIDRKEEFHIKGEELEDGVFDVDVDETGDETTEDKDIALKQRSKASAEGGSSEKYVPPQLRKCTDDFDARKKEELDRLKKMVKGLINRLSEPNLASISGQLEELYMTHSRKDMNETLTGILFTACVTPAMMPDRLLMEHVFLVSILHYTVGLEVGAHFLEAVVRKFDEVHRSGSEGKVCNNLIALLAHLYNFHVMHSVLIFDILKLLLDSFTEKDIEMILFLLKNVGFTLRKDDALALKELISEGQKKAALNKEFVDQSRVRFMLETMLALKNNDMRKIPGYDPESVERLRKLQKSMLHNSGNGKEAQLHVTFENILNADQTGRWWIVGSSWSGTPMISNADNNAQLKLPGGKISSKILELARKQRMNTDIRRTIFCVMMTSEDFLEAFENLLRLGLKDQQEREIVHVLIDCCLQEKTFNPFYAILGEKFCNYDRRFQMTFQCSMWDKFRELENLSDTAFSNLGDFLTHLLKQKSLAISVFKVIEFSELDKPKVRLLRHILRKLLMETGPEELAAIFGRISGIPKLGLLCEGLKLFISHFLLKTAHGNAEEVSLLKERASTAEKALQAKDSKLKL